jgi:predicted HNH restriction endonuclease
MTIDDLVIVCANCHAMIHRGGGCLDYLDLLKWAHRRGPR